MYGTNTLAATGSGALTVPVDSPNVNFQQSTLITGGAGTGDS